MCYLIVYSRITAADIIINLSLYDSYINTELTIVAVTSELRTYKVNYVELMTS